MIGASRGKTLSEDERAGVLDAMRSLPPQPDAIDGLRRLADAGVRLVALSNSSTTAVEAQLHNPGLAPFFERAFSVDAVRRFKPAPEPYRFVAQALGVETSTLRMVAAHAWDIVGAMRAGCVGAFVARSGKVLYPLAPPPDVVGPDLRIVAERIIAADTSDQ